MVSDSSVSEILSTRRLKVVSSAAAASLSHSVAHSPSRFSCHRNLTLPAASVYSMVSFTRSDLSFFISRS